MGLKNELIKKLEYIADNPQNEFDRIISNDRDILKRMSEAQLSDLYMLRNKSERLCRIIPYKRDEIALLTESGEVSPKSRVAELEDCFTAEEYILAKAKNEVF